MNNNINFMDVQELDGRNYGFIPMSGVKDRDTQLARLQDVMVADRDADAAKRAREYYGERVPVDNIMDETLAYFVGAAVARNMGIAEAPEAYWYGQDKDIPEVEQQDDLFEVMGRELMQDARTRWDAQKALADERVRGLDDLLPELVRAGDTGIDKGENWAKFFDGKARGVWKDEDHVSVAKAARAWDMMEGYLTSYAAAGAEMMTNATTAGLIMDTLRGDEMAEGLFFSTLQTRLGEMLSEAENENFLVQFGQQFDASGQKLAAGLMGGHYKAFATDEQVDDYNAELEKARKVSGLDRPNVELYAEGDNWFENALPVGNARLKAVRVAAVNSGQMNEDGSLRHMTDEERQATEELNAFRGKLTNAVNGIYDVDGVAALLGKMMPTSAAFVVPGGAAASFVSMRTQELAEQLGEGESWARANTVATVNAAISAAVEKIAFGSLNPTKWAFGLDKLMSQKVVARALGGIYGTTAGRIGLGVLAGTAEETLAEPTAGLLLAGVYNAMASTELDLEDPLGEYQKEIEGMLKPEQLLATALYGLLLGGVNWQGHKVAAAEYRDVRERLVAMGVEEGRAAAAARIDDPVKRAAAVQELIGQQVKTDAKGVLAYLAEVYPQLGEMATVENYFDKGQLPKVLPGKGGMVRVLEKGEDGKVSEVEMSADTARLMVAARLEEMSAKAQVEFADMVLGRAMVGSLKADGSRWVIEEVDEKMDHKYFQRLARAAEIKLAAGAREEDVDKSVHGFIPLGHLARQGEAWAQRMQVARHDYEQELGRKLTDDEWAMREKDLFSRVNRLGLRGQDGRMKTLLRVARGGFTAMEVLEDVTEDNLVRDMIANNRTLDFYIGNMQELEAAMGKPGAFLRQLRDENDSHTRMDVIEAMGKLVQSKVLADTARSGNGLSAALNAFLDMLRSWVLKAAALFKLGSALNKVLTDKEALAKVDAEFLGDIDRLVAQDVEWLKGVQLQEGLEAMWRVAKAAARVQAASATPVLDGAEAEHGEAVRAEARAKAERQRKVDADVAEGEAVLEGEDFSSSVVLFAARTGDDKFAPDENGKEPVLAVNVRALRADGSEAKKNDLIADEDGNVFWGRLPELPELKEKGYDALDIVLRLGARSDGFSHIVTKHGQWIMDAMGIDEPILACKRFIVSVLESVQKIQHQNNKGRSNLLLKKGPSERYFVVVVGRDRVEPKYSAVKTAFVADRSNRFDTETVLYEGEDALELRIPMSSFGENQRLRVASEQHDRSSDYPVAAASVPSEGNVPQVGEVVKGESVEPRRMPSGSDTSLSVADAREHGEFDSDKDSLDITFNAVGEHAANWDEIKHLAFKGRDDGKLRVELDASGARLKKAPRHRMDSSVVDELVARLRFFRDEVRRHGMWRRVEIEFGRGVVSDTVQEMVFLMRSVAAVGVDFGSYAELQESGMLELALNPTEEGARKLLRGRKIEGVLGFNKLGEVLDFPELYKAYPQLAELPVRWMGPEYKGRGTYVAGGRRFVRRRMQVRANRTPGGILSTLLHEAQHWIQHEEDFAFGADTTDAWYKRAAGEVEARNVQHRRWMSAEERVELPFNDTLEYPNDEVVVKTPSELMGSMSEAKEAGLFEDGVLEASNAVVVEPGVSFSVEALHASPHKFRKFDLSKMGTGEGAQAYGWGLYFAENHGVNRNYFNKFNRGKTYLDDFKVGGQDATYNEWTQAIDNIIKSTVKNKDILTWIRSVFDYRLHGANPDGLIYQAKSAVKFARANIKKAVTDEIRESEKVKLRRGQCLEKIGKAIKASGLHAEYKAEKLNAANYRVELNVDDSNLLMWDSPVADELQAEIDAMQRHVADEDWQETFAEMKALGIKGDNSKRENFTGWQVYKELARVMGTPKAASKWLAERGYKGIKYLDGTSRGKGEGSYNYVIFSGDDVKITGVNETGDFDAPWQDYEDTTASFSVVGENAANWDEIKHLAFRGRDDGKLRVELDASGAKLKEGAFVGDAGDEYRRMLAGDMPAEMRDLLVKLSARKKLLDRWYEILDETDDMDAADAYFEEVGIDKDWLWEYGKMCDKLRAYIKERLAVSGVDGEGKFGTLERMSMPLMDSILDGKLNNDYAEELAKMSKGTMYTLKDMLDYPELYKAYPDLRWLPVYFADMGPFVRGKLLKGAYPEAFYVNKSLPMDGVRSTLLHEIQHAIQVIEEFAAGGTGETARKALEQQIRQYRIRLEHLRKELQWINAVDVAKDHLTRMIRILKRPRAILKMGERFAVHEMMDVDVMAQQAIEMMWDEYTQMSIRDFGDTVAYAPGDGYKLPGRGSDVPTLDAVEKLLAKVNALPSRRQGKLRGRGKELERQIEQLYQENKPKLDMTDLSNSELYARLAGEIEARNVQLRRDWTAEERRARPFNETLEYPGEALVSFSVSPTLKEDIKRAAYNKLDSKYHIPLCTMPTVLRMLGVPEGDVYTLPSTIGKLVYTHNLAHPEVYRAIEELDDPLFVFRETDKTYVFVLEMESRNNLGILTNVMAAIQLERSESGHYLMSAYPLDALNKVKDLLQQKRLVYSKYTTAELEDLINKQATPPTDNAPSPFKLDLMRSAVKGGLKRDIPTKEDIVKWKDDFSASMVRMNEEYLVQDLVAAGGGFKANVEFVDKMVREMRQSLQRMKRLGSKTRTEREDAIAAMGSIVHMVKAVVQYLPKGYRFSVHPYVNKLEMLAEIATTGAIELTEEHNDMATRPLKKWLRVQRGLRDVMAMKGHELDVEQSVDELIREHGEMMLTETVERIIDRVAEQLRKHAKARVTEKIQELVKRLAPKRDKKTGKLKGGKMSADAYRDLEDVAIAMGMGEDELKAKLDALNAKLAEPGLSEDDRAQVESELALYDQFGNLQGMTAAEAMEAYEALRRRVWMHRFEWDNVMAERRVAQRAMAQSVVDAVGAVQENEYNAAKRVKGPVKRLKNVGDILAGLPQVMVSLRGYLPLRKMVDDLTRRANRAGEQLKAWEAERWEKLEALARKTMDKSWRLCMDDLHKVQKTGVSFDRPVYRTVSVRTEGLRELLAMSKTERRAEMKLRREAGGLEAETVLSERDIEALKGKLDEMEAAGRVLSVVEVKYVAEVRHEENLELSKGEALYAILLYEQPTYTERLEAQGYTPEVIAGFRRFIGEGVLQFGYGLREMFAEQGDRVAAVYERTFGVPFPREENYFAARWDLREKKGGPAEQLLAGMTGTPGAGNGWQKQRVNHNLELDMTKDALQVFLQATSLTDNWMATQDIVADFKAWTRNRDFAPAVTVMIGKDGYQNLTDWINLLEMGGVQDCLNMGASQDVINGLYGSGAVAILGLRIQTLIRQLPSVFNGLLGAYDISTGEWLATLAKMKHGDAPMTFKRMKDSVLIKNRQTGRAGAMAGQATRSNDMKSSKTEELILASMLPMEWVDARCTAMSLVPVWNVYYARAVEAGASHAEAERAAWEETAIVANRSSQPVGWMNKSKIGQHRNPIVKSLFYMLSENTAKFALCRGLWQGGQKKAAVRAWLVYGAANAVISALLDWLQGDPDDWEKGAWWEYALEYGLSAFYGPLAAIPGVGEAVEALTTVALQTTGEALDVEWLKKARGRASVGRALVDFQGMYRAVKKIVGFMTDDEEHGLAEYTQAASTISRTMAIGTGWMGNAVGYWNTVVAVGMNPLDFGARVWRNMKQYYGEE